MEQKQCLLQNIIKMVQTGFAKHIKELKKYQLIVDVQGDEPLLNPVHVDKVIKHLKNQNIDIVSPNLKIQTNNTNIVKIVSNKKNEVLYISRANIPYEFRSRVKYFKKHLSIVSFKPESLIQFSQSKRSDIKKLRI